MFNYNIQKCHSDMAIWEIMLKAILWRQKIIELDLKAISKLIARESSPDRDKNLEKDWYFGQYF